MNQNYKKGNSFNYREASFTLLFFASCILIIFSSTLFQETVIEYKWMFFLSILGSITTFILFCKVNKRLYFLIWLIVGSIIIGSGLFTFSFLYINKTLGEKRNIVSVKVFEIIDKGTLGKGRYANCYRPYVVIDFDGKRKQVVFLCEYQTSVKESKKIRLTFFKGFLGFKVIKSKQLLNDAMQ